MIELDSQLCEELDITYWQLKTTQAVVQYTISHEEKDLLRKILIAKAIKLEDEMLEIEAEGVVVVNLEKYQLIFSDVETKDNGSRIHLAKLSSMLVDAHQKKLTWYKLRDLDL